MITFYGRHRILEVTTISLSQNILMKIIDKIEHVKIHGKCNVNKESCKKSGEKFKNQLVLHETSNQLRKKIALNILNSLKFSDNQTELSKNLRIYKSPYI